MSDYYHQFLSSMSSGIGANAGVPPQQPPQPPPLQQQQQQQQQQPLPQQPLPQQHQVPPQQIGMFPSSMPPQLQQPPAMTMGIGLGPNQYQNLGLYAGFSEPVMFNAHKTQRHRRKSAPGVDHVKHRRTRSGCYTCRSRRIKCDEGRPTCERCKKGKRDCVYPEPPAGKQATSTGAGSGSASGGTTGQTSRETSTPSQHASPASSHGDDDDETDQDTKLDTIPDDEEAAGLAEGVAEGGGAAGQEMSTGEGGSEPQQFPVPFSTAPTRPQPRRSSTMSSSNQLRMVASAGATGGTASNTTGTGGTRHGSETPSLEGKSSSPATSTGTGGSNIAPTGVIFSLADPFAATATTASAGIGGMPSAAAEWSHLPQDVRFYLSYYTENITNYHYCLIDSESFFRVILPTLAVRNEALLYAVVGFSAYHYMLRNPVPNLQLFLQYYDRSVKLLLGFLKRKEKHNLATLMTILHLATIEEYLGDWVNLMGHQRAALEVLMELFTPETALQTPLSRVILQWYARFDVFVGLMGGFETALPRPWFVASVNFYRDQLAREPTSLRWKFEEFSARIRLVSMEMSLLYGRFKQDAGGDGPGSSDTDPASVGGSPNGLGATPAAAAASQARQAEADAYYSREHTRLLAVLQELKDDMDSLLTTTDAAGNIVVQGTPPCSPIPMTTTAGFITTTTMPHPLLVTEFPHARPLTDDDIVNPFQPGILYREPLFTYTLLICEWMSIMLMHEWQAVQRTMAAAGATTAAAIMEAIVAATTGAPAAAAAAEAAAGAEEYGAAGGAGQGGLYGLPAKLARLGELALGICRIFETIELYPTHTPGALIILQATIAIAALFLPRDNRHHMWVRRKFALIESMGYIFPLTMRSRMAELFGDPSCVRWWLPNDEGFTPTLQSIRAFADERNVTAVSSQVNNIREIRHVFEQLQLGGNAEGTSPEDRAAAGGSSGLGDSVSDPGVLGGSSSSTKGKGTAR